MSIDLRNDIQFEGQGELMQGLGSYWNSVFEDRAIVSRLMAAVQDQYRQADINTTEIVQGADITEAPVLHTQVWYKHRIYKDRQADGNVLGPKYDPEGRQYGDGAQYGVGDPYLWMYELPSTLVRPRAICNRVTAASHITYEGAGYYFAPGYIGFTFNPFASDLWPVVETDDGQAVDLWLYVSDWDTQLLQQRYALAVGISAPSTDDYRLLLEGVWQGRMLDRGRNALYKILEGASGVPLAHVSEVVEHAFSDDEYSYVITDTEVYRVPKTTILVDVGDQLYKGQSLFESFILTNQQDWDGYDITLPPSFFNPEIGVRYPITFPNADVPVTYLGQDSEGRTLYRFTLYGEAQDLIRYRQYLVENNFVQALDNRGSRQTQPGAADLVSTVNPATDIVARLVVPNLMLAVVDKNLWSTDDTVRSHLEKQVRRFVHPHSRLLIQQQQPLDSESWSSWSSVSESSESSSTEGTTLSSLSSPSSTSSSDTTSSASSSSSSSQSDVSTSSSTFSASSVSTSSETSSSISSETSSSTATASSKSSQSESTSSTSSRSSLSSNSSTSSTDTSSSISSNTSSSSSSSTDTSSSSTLWMTTSSTQSTESTSSSSTSETSSSETSGSSSSPSTVTESSISSSSSTILINESSLTSSSSSSSTLWMTTSSTESTASSQSTQSPSSESSSSVTSASSSSSSTFSEPSSQSIEGEFTAMMGEMDSYGEGVFRGLDVETQVVSLDENGDISPSMLGTFHGLHWSVAGEPASYVGDTIRVHGVSSGLALMSTEYAPSQTPDNDVWYYGNPATGQRKTLRPSPCSFFVVSAVTGELVYDLAKIYNEALCPLEGGTDIGSTYVDFRHDPDDGMLYLAFGASEDSGTHRQYVVCYDPASEEIKWAKTYKTAYGRYSPYVSIELAHNRLYVLYSGDNDDGYGGSDDAALYIEGLVKGASGGSVTLAADQWFNDYPSHDLRSMLFYDEDSGFLGVFFVQYGYYAEVQWMNSAGERSGYDYGKSLYWNIDNNFDSFAKPLGFDQQGYLVVVGDISTCTGPSPSVSGKNGLFRVKIPSSISGTPSADSAVDINPTAGSPSYYDLSYFRMLTNDGWLYAKPYNGVTQVNGVDVDQMFRYNVVDHATEALASHGRAEDWVATELASTLRSYVIPGDSSSSWSSQSGESESSSSSQTEQSSQSDTPAWESYLDTSPPGSDFAWTQDFVDYQSAAYSYAGYSFSSTDADYGKRSALELTFDRFSGDPVSMYLKQNGQDSCRVYVDGIVVLEGSQIGTSWAEYLVDVPAGSHTIRWECTKTEASGVYLRVDTVTLPVTQESTSSTATASSSSSSSSQSDVSTSSQTETESSSSVSSQSSITESLSTYTTPTDSISEESETSTSQSFETASSLSTVSSSSETSSQSTQSDSSASTVTDSSLSSSSESSSSSTLWLSTQSTLSTDSSSSTVTDSSLSSSSESSSSSSSSSGSSLTSESSSSSSSQSVGDPSSVSVGTNMSFETAFTTDWVAAPEADDYPLARASGTARTGSYKARHYQTSSVDRTYGLTQRIDLNAYGSRIDRGEVVFNAGVWARNYYDQDQNRSKFIVHALDAGGDDISILYNHDWAEPNYGSYGELTMGALRVLLPVGCRGLRFTILSRSFTAYDYIYYDDAYVTLYIYEASSSSSTETETQSTVSDTESSTSSSSGSSQSLSESTSSSTSSQSDEVLLVNGNNLGFEAVWDSETDWSKTAASNGLFQRYAGSYQRSGSYSAQLNSSYHTPPQTNAVQQKKSLVDYAEEIDAGLVYVEAGVWAREQSSISANKAGIKIYSTDENGDDIALIHDTGDQDLTYNSYVEITTDLVHLPSGARGFRLEIYGYTTTIYDYIYFDDATMRAIVYGPRSSSSSSP